MKHPAKFKKGDRVRVIAPHTAWTDHVGTVVGISGLRTLDWPQPRYISVQMDNVSPRTQDAMFKENELVYENAIQRLGDLS